MNNNIGTMLTESFTYESTNNGYRLHYVHTDNYMQDPTTQQGFNRYAYCMYNPLKYVDPSGERIAGWDPLYLAIMEASEPTNNSNNPNSNGKPGSSEDNPISTSNLTTICDVWYAVGNGNPLYVDNSIMDFWFLSQGDLTLNKDGNYTINLFVFPYMLIAPDLAMALGQITFEYVGDNMYRMLPDKYNFDVKDGEYFSNWRNFATSLGGILHGGINEPTFLLHPATYWGGEFEINFLNNVYIKPGP